MEVFVKFNVFQWELKIIYITLVWVRLGLNIWHVANILCIIKLQSFILVGVQSVEVLPVEVLGCHRTISTRCMTHILLFHLLSEWYSLPEHSFVAVLLATEYCSENI